MLAPTGLLTDLLAFPEKTRIATRRPSFGWIVNGGQPGPDQSAYQIELRDANDDVVGDSDCVENGESLNHFGPELVWGESYSWKVRTWDKNGTASPWSEPQRFTLADAEPTDPVSAYPLETISVAPVRVQRERKGGLFIDFGRAAFGWLEITNPGSEARTVTVRLGEKRADGRIDPQPPGSVRFAEVALELPAGQTTRVATPPDERNTTGAAILLPPELGVILPFRYAEISGLPADFPIETNVRLVRVQYPFTENGELFKSSDESLNQIWEFCRYSIQATTFAGYYVDGDRERIPYEADAYINQLGHYAADREFSLARRTHEYLMAYPTWPTEWKQFSILLAGLDYEATGDTRSIARQYDALKAEKLLLNHARADGLLDTNGLRDIVDWPHDERDEYDFRPVNTVVNAFHFRTLEWMAKMAAALGRTEDADDFSTRALRVAESFQRTFWSESLGAYVDGEGSAHASLHASAFALAFGLVPEERLERTLTHIKSRDMACSVYAVQFLLEGLFEVGEADYALQLILSDDIRSWKNMLRQDATITWEAWDQTFKPNQDWNHAWGAAPINILSRYVLGVQPLEAGYGKVRIRPQLGPLREVHGTVPTIRGDIRVHAWRNSPDAAAEFTIEVPANVKWVAG